MENSFRNKENPDIVILVNGPGELSSYVKPTVTQLHESYPGYRITIVFTPCPYSTGKETEIALAFPGVSRVINAGEFFVWMLRGILPQGIKFGASGAVLFMGGDVLYGKMIAKRLKYPAVAYSEAYAKWPKIYKRFLVPDRLIYEKFKKQGYPESQIKIVGNLMVESVRSVQGKAQIFAQLGLDPGKKLVSFLPGSREFQIQYTLTFFSEVANIIDGLKKDCQFAFIISPYLKKELLDKHLKNTGSQVTDDLIKYKDTTIKIIFQGQHDVIAASDIIITIPGTNTAEVAVLGTPMIVVFPEKSSELIPLEGIYEIIGNIPFLGYFFKKLYVKMLLQKTRFFAIPNIKSGREIVPEFKGDVQPKTLAETAVLLLNDGKKLDEMGKLLRSSLGSSGAAKRITEEIHEVIS
jgi:Lipid-A-disaccharide synthetase